MFFNFYFSPDEVISQATKNRSLIKSKFRKGSLSRSDETYFSLANTTANNSTLNQPTPSGGSTALNYSNSTASTSGTANSRKSLISNPINFQHLHHMGPNDGKSFISDIATPLNTSGLPPLANTRMVNISTLNNSNLNDSANHNHNHHHPPPKKSTSTSGVRQIAKNDISAPTNFRHVVKGLDDFGLSKEITQQVKVPHSPPSVNKSISTRSTDSTPAQNIQLPTIQQQQQAKSSSLSSSSSSSSSILNSPNSLNTSANTNNNINTENLTQSISNTLKANSVLYNGKFE